MNVTVNRNLFAAVSLACSVEGAPTRCMVVDTRGRLITLAATNGHVLFVGQTETLGEALPTASATIPYGAARAITAGPGAVTLDIPGDDYGTPDAPTEGAKGTVRANEGKRTEFRCERPRDLFRVIPAQAATGASAVIDPRYSTLCRDAAALLGLPFEIIPNGDGPALFRCSTRVMGALFGGLVMPIRGLPAGAPESVPSFMRALRGR